MLRGRSHAHRGARVRNRRWRGRRGGGVRFRRGSGRQTALHVAHAVFLMPSFDPTLTAPGAKRPAPVRFREGDVIAGRYRIARFIAQGGMGEVYEAEDVTLGERIALKTVSVERSGDPRADEYFRRELLLARKVTHPNVCRLFDVGVHDQTRFLTMELLAGETLAARIRRRPLESADALPIVQQMTAALAAAHAVGIVHRDFKSHNVILVRPEGGGA